MNTVAKTLQQLALCKWHNHWRRLERPGTWSAFLVPSISGSYAITADTVTATLTENSDSTVTGTVDGMIFTDGSLVGGYPGQRTDGDAQRRMRSAEVVVGKPERERGFQVFPVLAESIP